MLGQAWVGLEESVELAGDVADQQRLISRLVLPADRQSSARPDLLAVMSGHASGTYLGGRQP